MRRNSSLLVDDVLRPAARLRGSSGGRVLVVQELELMRTAYSKYYLVVLALRPEVLEDCDERFVGSAA